MEADGGEAGGGNPRSLAGSCPSLDLGSPVVPLGSIAMVWGLREDQTAEVTAEVAPAGQPLQEPGQ